jgi:hypothetical protein
MKPLLLVDVDGVLNCFGSMWTPEYEERTFMPVLTKDGRFSIRINKETPERLARLTEVFEPVWATAWMGDAHPFFCGPCELGEAWEHIAFTGWHGNLVSGSCWKRPWVEQWLEQHGDRPAAWLDDDLHADDIAWAESRCREGKPTLVVKTEPSRGLTRVEEKALMAWAKYVTEGAVA